MRFHVCVLRSHVVCVSGLLCEWFAPFGQASGSLRNGDFVRSVSQCYLVSVRSTVIKNKDTRYDRQYSYASTGNRSRSAPVQTHVYRGYSYVLY